MVSSSVSPGGWKKSTRYRIIALCVAAMSLVVMGIWFRPDGAEPSIVLDVNTRRVTAGEPFRVTIEARVPKEALSGIVLPSFDGVHVIEARRSRTFSGGKNGRLTDARFVFVLSAPQSGTCSIGPASVMIDGVLYASGGAVVTVTGTQAPDDQEGR